MDQKEQDRSELCDVEELKSILKSSEDDSSLLASIQATNSKQRNKPPAYFSFPGTKGSMISLPPFHKWPIQIGWSFSTWLYLEPKPCGQPYLYNFKTSKSGLGYSAHFTGDCLVLTSIRVKGKGVQHCVAYEFPPNKWIHCAITYHNKWRASEIKVYINGQLAANIQMPWQVQTTEHFDRCFIGGAGVTTSTAASSINDRADEINCFCGQMSALYLFNEGLSPAQICAIHRLGPSYMGQFKYSNESYVNLPPQITKALYEEKLASTLFCLFTPVAVDSDTLCIQLAPFRSSTTVSAQNYFVSAPHAALLGQTKAITTQPISSTLHSLGCSRSLLPLLDSFASKGDPLACASLIAFLCDLLESSPHWFANDIVQNNGFVVVACALASNARVLLTESLLDIFLNLTRTLLTTCSSPGDSTLLKHLMDNILFNPTLWIYADTKLQIKLYSYLATEFLNGTRNSSNKYTITNSSTASPFVPYDPTTSATLATNDSYYSNASSKDMPNENDNQANVSNFLFGETRRVSTVLQTLHSLKYFYWLVEEKNINPKARNYRLRPNQEELLIIRSHILSFTKELICRAQSIPMDEIQSLLNYLSSCSHGDNLLDVINLLSSLLKEHPSSIAMALDQKQGIKVLFILIGSQHERVRVEALKLLGLFLSNCSNKKKQDNMGPNNLFMLLCERLSPYKPLTIEVYGALIDILLESNEPRTMEQTSSDSNSRDLSKCRIENSIIIKVIATLIHEERIKYGKLTMTERTDSLCIRKIFINDLWNLIVGSKENRRIILQMSVWQHWLINLIDNTISDSQLVMDQILAIFRVLLYHAIRYEYGGWRVWIDTLAIIHTKVSYDDFCKELNNDSNHSITRAFEEQLTRDYKSAHNSPIKEPEIMQLEENSEIVESKKKDYSNENDDDKIDDDTTKQQQSVVSSISERIPRESSGIQMVDEKGIDEVDEKGIDEVDEKGVDDVDEKVVDDVDEKVVDEVDEKGIDEVDEKGVDEVDENGIDEVDEKAVDRVDKKAVDETETKKDDKESSEQITNIDNKENRDKENNKSHHNSGEESIDSVDLAPSREFRKLSLKNSNQPPAQQDGSESSTADVTSQQSMTSIPLEEPSQDTVTLNAEESETIKESPITMEDSTNKSLDQNENNKTPDVQENTTKQKQNTQTSRATASPAFRIPEFKWGNILIKLLNDLMFSIECDLYHWRCSAKCTNLDMLPFVPKTATSNQNSNNTTNSSKTSNATTIKIETILQKPENQIYIMNIIHFISQLADNIIIASGGLLPLLADATGGSRSSNSTSTPTSEEMPVKEATCEGLTSPQANSILYRLINMVDIVIFAACHVNLAELEADKNTTSGGILRQCLRLACTVTVKNCLIVRTIHNKISSMGIGGNYIISASDFPKDMFNSYQGCSLLSANGLFQTSNLTLDNSDLIADVEYSPHQTPNASTMPSLLPFQSAPIRDPNKLLQLIDISRIQACIYHDASTESRQSQFLALSSLYFISVLMVSKYRDIIEPKQKNHHKSKTTTTTTSSSKKDEPSTGYTVGSSISNIESNLLNFGKLQPNSPATNTPTNTTSALTDLLTTKLENTLDSVCPLLKSIMCDFSTFLSKTLVGSHGQDLVNKEAERTFRRANTSPVELVMLLCSQEWQNTLQKNAGLAFIELINEGRVLSHGMKDHIVRVAMEAEFILSRLRADDVAKHEHFGIICSETQSARIHEELLINSLISSAVRRDYLLYCKFKESVLNRRLKNYRLDIWEDDDRRKRRFVIDSWDDSYQNFYSNNTIASTPDTEQANETKRILDLQETIELGVIDDQNVQESDESQNIGGYKEEDCCEEDYEEDEEDEGNHHVDSNSPESDNDNHHHRSKNSNNHHHKNKCLNKNDNNSSTMIGTDKSCIKNQNLYSNNGHKDDDSNSQLGIDNRSNQVWTDYDDCGSINDYTGSVIFAAECLLIWNIYAIPGIFQLTTHELHFEPNQNISELIDNLKKDSNQGKDLENDEVCSLKSHPGSQHQHESLGSSDQITLRKLDLKVLRYCEFLLCNGKILLNDIRAIFSRHYLLQPHALEIFLAQRTSVMFAFSDFETVRRAIKYLPPVGVGIKYGVPQNRRASLMTPRQLFSASNMTSKWQKREIGNFQYLMFLNTIAGRTYQDLNQYPVFPWILTNYESEELDLNLPSNFRDLSKPVGALNNKRRAEFIERYQSWDNPKVPAFHYGTHYSTAAFTLNWLCRLRGSFNSAYLALQDGKYEENSRLFLSIGDSWVSSLVSGQQNVKELIPEFFHLPEMFHANLGLSEVEYPPWAKSAEQFVRLHRLALESELVSCQLHQWIDLIFGYKQRGPEAINAINTFYYLTYQGNVNLNMVQDPSLREAIEMQIKHFGQTPSQLTTEPHQPRFSALHVSPTMFSPPIDEINKVIKFPFNTSIVSIWSCISNYTSIANDNNASTGSITTQNNSNSPSSILTITSNNQYQIHKWCSNEQSGHPFVMDPQLEQSNSLRRQLIDVDDIYSGIQLKLTNSHTPKQDQILDEVPWTCAHYVVTLDGRYIIVGSFYDNSFRVFATESGKLCQVIYGHRGPITCMVRSDGNAAADFYIATGSRDCSLLLWTWNEKYAQVEGSGVSAVHNPLPKLTITGHQTAILSVCICAELGLIISGSKNLILVNTTTNGENLLEINVLLPDILDKTTFDKRRHSQQESNIMHRPLVQDKQKALLEASMLGDDINSVKNKKQTIKPENEKSSQDDTNSISVTDSTSERFSFLKALCKSDYYITNLQLARELAFIVCVALPPPPKRRYKTLSKEDDSMDSGVITSKNTIKNSAALLMTFNMKGSLVDSTTIGQAVNSPKLGDTCILQTTRDGEHIILNDSPTTIKIYRTFDLLPVYAYNTNDIPNTLGEDQNRVKSLALLDYKFILVGLENGKIIVYNADFNNL